MRLFSESEAEHFCQNYTPRIGDSERAIKEFFNSHWRAQTVAHEGSNIFNEYRACLLRDTERNLFLSASQYRRCLDLMLPSSSHWAHVTSYYGTLYAAQALLGLFGCRIFAKYVIDVGRGFPTTQQLVKRRIGPNVGQEPATATGSHERFWELFYKAVAPLIGTVESHLTIAITPVGGDEYWQTRKRNEINYESYHSTQLIEAFKNGFDKTNFPGSLPGAVNTQYRVFEATIELAFNYATKFRLNTDCLAFLGAGPLKLCVRDKIYAEKIPSLIRKTRKSDIF